MYQIIPINEPERFAPAGLPFKTEDQHAGQSVKQERIKTGCKARLFASAAAFLSTFPSFTS